MDKAFSSPWPLGIQWSWLSPAPTPPLQPLTPVAKALWYHSSQASYLLITMVRPVLSGPCCPHTPWDTTAQTLPFLLSLGLVRPHLLKASVPDPGEYLSHHLYDAVKHSALLTSVLTWSLHPNPECVKPREPECLQELGRNPERGWDPRDNSRGSLPSEGASLLLPCRKQVGNVPKPSKLLKRSQIFIWSLPVFKWRWLI